MAFSSTSKKKNPLGIINVVYHKTHDTLVNQVKEYIAQAYLDGVRKGTEEFVTYLISTYDFSPSDIKSLTVRSNKISAQIKKELKSIPIKGLK